MLGVAAAGALLAGFAAGTVDAAALIADPVVAVALKPGDDLSLLAVPAGLPAVVVAVGRDAPALPAGGPDVAVTSAAHPPAPWVSVPDLAAEVERLLAAVRAHPGAAVALAGVLRAGRATGVDAGLVVESLAYSTLQAGPEFGRWRAGREGSPGRAAPSGDPVVVARAGDVLSVTLDRPEVHNAYNAAMRDALHAALTVALADPRLSVELSGRGPSFCSGGDLTEFGTAPDPVTSHLVRTARSPGRLLHALGRRTTARLHGSCAGSGIELPAFAGRVVADPATRIWLPELGMGLIPGAGGTVSLPRRIGPGRTAWLGLSGRTIGAGVAQEWGLVDEVEPGRLR